MSIRLDETSGVTMIRRSRIVAEALTTSTRRAVSHLAPCLGCRVRVQCVGVQGAGCGVRKQGVGCRVQGVGCRVRVKGEGCRV